LQKELGLDATLMPGSGGVFDVMVNGGMIFSRSQMGRFPDTREIIQILKE
jgi:selenoprotein W-related protein